MSLQKVATAPADEKLWLYWRKLILPGAWPKLYPDTVNSCIKFAEDGSTSSISTAVVTEGEGVTVGVWDGVTLGEGIWEGAGIEVGKGNGFKLGKGKGKGEKKEITMGTAKSDANIYLGSSR